MAARPLTVRFLLIHVICSCVLLTLGIAKKKPPATPVNLNTAASEELQQVPGIGPVTAEKILQMRKWYGPFKSVDDLLAIRGLGPKRLEKMRKYLTVGKPGMPKQTTPSAKSAAKSSTPPAASPPAGDAKAPPR
jgi:comEA protein